MNKALLIAFHYPPVSVSSGLQRTLANSRYLRDYGWEPIVLSAHPRAYERTSEDQLKDIPPDLPVYRGFALDTARHLAFKGRYLDWLALPDRWVSWWLGGVLTGLRVIRKHKPRVIWSTYPIATAHLIAYSLHKLTGIPWVADFRDSMTEEGYPRERRRRKAFLWLERKVVTHCSKAIFTTPGAVRMYRERYPEILEERWAVIANGYNEDIFLEVEKDIDESGSNSPLTLVHSGVVYPSERDPGPFFKALAELKKEGKISASRVKVIFRASGHDQLFQPMLKELDIEDILVLAPPVPYREALKEILSVDALLVLQASNCNHQIPAKIYEYFRARKPVLSLTDREGDTAKTLLEAGLDQIASLDDISEIKEKFNGFIEGLAAGKGHAASEEAIEKYSRRHGAHLLADIFSEQQS